MKNPKVLIVGAGIAGPTLAHWLRRYGFQPTLVERAKHLRSGGYVIDFWGVGYDVADRMGILPTLEQYSLPMDSLKLVDDEGKQRGGFGRRAVQALTGKRYLSLLRSDLARVVYDSLGGDVPTIFGDSLVSVRQDGDGVFVEFRHHSPERFDLVIGAGGLHSPVRQLVFGAESSFEEYLGYYAASFTAADYPHQEPHAFVSHAQPGRQATRYTLKDGLTVFLLVFAAKEKLPIAHNDIQSQKDVLHREFGDAGWECKEILRRLDQTNELYFDAVSQIHMDRWSRNRSALVGDACGCPSLLAGQGSSLAMAGAYILAGELGWANGDYAAAFDRYEKLFQPVIKEKQRAAKRFAKSFVPGTRTGIIVRNHVTKLMNIPFIADITMGRMIRDPITLPEYRFAGAAARRAGSTPSRRTPEA